MSIKFVLIIQCDTARLRCSGFACMKSFYDREGFFKDLGYEHGVRYMALTCGGCCGTSLASKLEHFSNKLLRQTEIKKDQVAVHLSTCMATENYHHDRCPNLEYIKRLILKKGYKNIVEGTFRSANATKKRDAGIYKDYELQNSGCDEE
ncbi:MAG: CGGC domain-containing protein [Synergistaceae bacterium]|nr:CGGC domain-containing protein [Synergistaceae bacterium]